MDLYRIDCPAYFRSSSERSRVARTGSIILYLETFVSAGGDPLYLFMDNLGNISFRETHLSVRESFCYIFAGTNFVEETK